MRIKPSNPLNRIASAVVLAVFLAVTTMTNAHAGGGHDPANEATRPGVPLSELHGVSPPDDPIEQTPLTELPNLPAALERVERLVERGEWSGAESVLQALLDGDAASRHELWYWLALARAGQLQFDAARAAAHEATRRAFGDADVHFLLAGLWQQRRDYHRAQEHYLVAARAGETELTNVTPTIAWFELGRLLAQRNYALAAAEAYANFDRRVFETHREQRNEPRIAAVLRVHPLGMLHERVRLLRIADRRALAVAATTSAYRRDRAEPEVVRLHALALAEAGRGAEAWDVIAPLLAADSINDTLVPAAVRAARAAARLDAWIADLVVALNAGQQLDLAWRVFDAAALDAPAAALTLGEALHTALPADSELAHTLIDTALRAGAWPVATGALDRYFSAHAERRALPLDALRTLDRWFEKYPAWAAHLRAQSASDDDVGLLMARAVLASLAGDAAQAEAVQRLAARPQQATLAKTLPALALLEAYEWDAALQLATAQLDEGASAAWPYYVKGVAHLGRNEIEPGIAALREAISRDEAAVSYSFALAEAYHRNGNRRSAPRFYRAVLERMPTHSAAIDGLFETYIQDNKLDVAEQLYETVSDRRIAPASKRMLRGMLDHLDDLFGTAHREELERWRQIFPADVRVTKLLCGALLSRGDHEGARDAARAGLEHAPEDYNFNFVLAQAAAFAGDFPAAIKAFRRLHDWYPRRPTLLLGLARALLFDFQLEAGRAVLRDMLALELDDEQRDTAQAALQSSYATFGEFDQALALVRAWRAADPADENLFLTELSLLQSAKRLDQARALLQAWYEEEPRARLDSFIALGRSLEMYDALAAAIQSQVPPENMTVDQADTLITVLLRAGKTTAAAQIADGFNSSFSEATRRRIWLGRIAAAEGDLDRALREFDALLTDRFITEEARVNIAREVSDVLLEARAFARAAEWLDDWLRKYGGGIDPNVRLELLRTRRALLGAAGEDEAGLALAEQLLELRPTDPVLLNDVGYTWADAGRKLARARDMIAEAVAAAPWNAAYLDSLGWVYYKLGELDNAIEYLTRATRLFEGRDSTIFDHLGDAHWRAADQAAAARAWRSALEIIAEERAAEFANPRLDDLARRVRNKLAAVESSGTPPVAPIGQVSKE